MWTKHRNAIDVFTFNFATALDATETVATGGTAAPEVKVLKRQGLAWIDKTTDFVEGTPALDSTNRNLLPWRAKAGDATTQPGDGSYAVHGAVTTSAGRRIVWIEDLQIIDKAAT